MMVMGWLDTAVVLVAAGGSAWFAVWFLLNGRPNEPRTSAPDDPVVVTFRDGSIVKASPAAETLLDTNAARDDWDDLRRTFAGRFIGFPDHSDDLMSDTRTVLKTDNPLEDPAQLALAGAGGEVTVTLADARQSTGLRHMNHLLSQQLDQMESAVSGVPHPIWIVDGADRLVWGNAAYWHTARAHLGARARDELLFEPADLRMLNGACEVRCAVAAPDPTKKVWFDIVSVTKNDLTHYYATDVTAVVRAEAAQRNFVQTLTKTFAHLSIGLAIFDRDRQLALFNPALIDLTELSPEFLSNRPNLLSFFDRLREHQVMPEPKNYSGWRETLADVVIAASDGRYSETWNLPSGLTYRVTGRPHPDGAIAFLFEDISAEISLTRRFREELEIGHAVLDTLDSAIAVFASSGRLTFSNAAYDQLWGVESDVGLDEVSVQATTDLWQSQCQPTPIWSDMRNFIVSYGAREGWMAYVHRADGRSLQCSVQPIAGGATLVRFETAEGFARKETTLVPA